MRDIWHLLQGQFGTLCGKLYQVDEGKSNFVLTVRQATGDTQLEFADRLGVSVRSVKRFEGGGVLPTNKGALRTLDALARKYGILPRSPD